MCDRITDLVGLQTSVGREFRKTYNLKIIAFFTLFKFMAIITMWRLFNKYCSEIAKVFDTKNHVNLSFLYDDISKIIVLKMLPFKKQQQEYLFALQFILC